MRFRWILLILFWLYLSATGGQEILGQSCSKPEVIKKELILNKKITSSIKECEIHRYPIELKNGQSLRANIKEKGVDVTAAVIHHDPDNLEQFRAEGYISDWSKGFERETLIFVTYIDGSYSIEIYTDQVFNKESSYELEILVDSEPVERSFERMKAVEQFNVADEEMDVNQQLAASSLQTALLIWEKIGDKYWQGKTAQNLALVYFKLGNAEKISELLKKSITLFSKEDISEIAFSKIILGDTYITFLADFDSARKEYQEALSIIEKVEGNLIEQPLRSLLSTVNNKGIDFEKYLALVRARNDKNSEALALTQIIMSIPLSPKFSNSNEREQALKTYAEQALALSKKDISTGSKSHLIYSVCYGYSVLIDGREFESLCLESLMLNITENKFREILTFAMIFNAARLENYNSAIFYGKLAIKGLQDFRKSSQIFEVVAQQNYLKKLRGVYRNLASTLISKGRLSEAQQIINLSRDEEFFDPDYKESKTPPDVRLSRREEENEALLKSALIKTNIAYKDLAGFKNYLGNNTPHPENAERMQGFENRYKKSYDDYLAVVKKIEADFSQTPSDKDKVGEIADTKEMQTVLQQLNEQTGEKVVAVYQVVDEDSFSALVITPNGIEKIIVPVKGEEINEKAKNLWFLLQSDRYDTTILSKEIYDIVFKPLENKLPKDTTTIMWSLDENLRYLPTAALFDGERFLVERYNHAVFTRADAERMTRNVSPTWTGNGFGVSKAATVNMSGENFSFVALPSSKEELSEIFKSNGDKGIFSGKILLDANFSQVNFINALKQKRPLVHIASHFSFRPGDEANSFLLMGDKTAFTLKEMKQEKKLFEGVELLTLSACNTAAQQSGADGREIDAFAELAQRLGASSIMATLWRVREDSTTRFMTAFYKNRENKKLNKVKALRDAQLFLLHGKTHILNDSEVSLNAKSEDGVVSKSEVEIDKKYRIRYQKDPERGYAHPYYWSPFILFGNWK